MLSGLWVVVLCQAKAVYDCLIKAQQFLETERKGLRFGEWTPHEIEVRPPAPVMIGSHS